ncbi:restriction endonuclease [Streptomyces sp. NPDC051636]|uniref:restriction endonuclease n=1 Tax=Streptomyces sp. NPDC051636 TaxID=3365663 RepID=UPI00378C0AAE
MSTPARDLSRARRRRPFDLRATALYFALLALLLCALGLTARAAAAAFERRPAWIAVLCLVGTAAALAQRRRRHRRCAQRAAHRAAAALDAATRTAVEALEAPHPPGHSPVLPPETVTDGPPAAYDAGGAVDHDALDPDEFEQTIAALCERDGCSPVEVVGGAGDLGADILAVTPDGRRVVIQCKRYGATNRVGSEDLQRFGGTCYTVHEADVAVVVTTSGFTAPAAEYAELCGIVCVDRRALRAWSDNTGPAPWICQG